MRIKASGLTLVVTFVATWPVNSSAGEDWTQFLGPHGDNSYRQELRTNWESEEPQVLWRTPVGPGFAGVAVSEGEVFLLDRLVSKADVLRCLALEDGRSLWSFEYECRGRLSYAGSRTVPAVTQDQVYTLGAFGQVYCLDRKTGKPLWSLHQGERFHAERPFFGWCQSPLLFENLVILAPLGADVGLAALDRDSGATVWTTPSVGQGHSTPILVELCGLPQVLMISAKVTDAERPQGQTPEQSRASAELGSGGFLSSWDPATGEPLWSSFAPACTSPVAPPLRVDDHTLFVTGGYRAGSVLLEVTEDDDGWNVTEVFRHPLGSSVHPAVYWEEHLYLAVNENFNEARPRWHQGGLMCLDLLGEELWRTGAQPNFGRGPYLMANGILIAQDGHDGTLRMIETTAEKYRPLAECQLFPNERRRQAQMWAPMALAEGRLLLRSQDELVCLDLR
jgi:outer membrane protein assembly factor BamB